MTANMTDRNFILIRYPGAVAIMNPDTGTFKIYAGKLTWIALSASCGSEAEAWRDAAEAINARESVKCG